MDGTWVAAAAFVVQTAIILVGSGIAYARQEGRLHAMVAKTTKEIEEEINISIRQFGETAQAIRQKINEVELFMRDNFIKRDSFYHGISELTSNLKGLGESLDGRLVRMENKIDETRKSQKSSGGT